jgi:hypothetical protein
MRCRAGTASPSGALHFIYVVGDLIVFRKVFFFGRVLAGTLKVVIVMAPADILLF